MTPQRPDRNAGGHRVLTLIERRTAQARQGRLCPALAGHSDDPRIIVDPHEVPAVERALLESADPQRIPPRRTPLPRRRRRRLEARRLAGLAPERREDAAACVSWAGKSAALSVAIAASPIILDLAGSALDVTIPPVPLIFVALGAGMAGAASLLCVALAAAVIGLRVRPGEDTLARIARTHHGHYLTPEDFDEDGRALVTEAAAIVDDTLERLPHQAAEHGPVLREHLWHIAAESHARYRARLTGTPDAAAWQENRHATRRHIDQLAAYAAKAVREEVDRPPEMSTGSADQELRARTAGTEARINELTTDNAPAHDEPDENG